MDFFLKVFKALNTRTIILAHINTKERISPSNFNMHSLIKSENFAQLNPTVTDLKGLNFLCVIGELLLLPVYEIKKSSSIGQKDNFHY